MAKKKKPLNARELFDWLDEKLQQGEDLSKVTLNFRADRDSDTTQILVVEEDLFDAKTNRVLESIVFIADPREV